MDPIERQPIHLSLFGIGSSLFKQPTNKELKWALRKANKRIDTLEKDFKRLFEIFKGMDEIDAEEQIRCPCCWRNVYVSHDGKGFKLSVSTRKVTNESKHYIPKVL